MGTAGLIFLSLLALLHAQRFFDHGHSIPSNRTLNIAHRGFSGIYPEHTAPAYRSAIEHGADVIECDVCVTKDLQLVCMHESWMSDFTNAAEVLPVDRMNTYVVPGSGPVTDYFSMDFTLEELAPVRMRQRMSFRDQSYNDMFPLVTVGEHIQIAKNSSRIIVLYPEMKDPDWVNSLEFMQAANTTFEELLANELAKYGYTSEEDPCFVQSFSEDSLRRLDRLSNVSLCIGLPAEISVSNSTLEDYSTFLYGLSANKRLAVKRGVDGYILTVTDIVQRAHVYGLRVHLATMRNEDEYLLWDYMQDPYLEFKQYVVDLEVDGVMTDFPASLDRYLDFAYEK